MQLKHATLLAALMAAGFAHAQSQPVIGLITKTETNPFFVKMKEGATEAAKAKGAKLLSGAGKADGDNAGQVTAMENMIAAGAKTGGNRNLRETPGQGGDDQVVAIEGEQDQGGG